MISAASATETSHGFGTAAMTVFGDLPLLGMDVRPASDQVLFSRVDMDENASLRFAYHVEEVDGAQVLIYRNGGVFSGVPRDSRLKLVSVQQDPARWRFCDVDAGCSYADVSYEFASAAQLIMDVRINEQPHMYWDATRVESRQVPEPFPVEPAPVAADSDFPPMPALVASSTLTLSVSRPSGVHMAMSSSGVLASLNITP